MQLLSTPIDKTYLEGAHQCLIHTHHGTCIIEFTTVVGCREERYQLTFCKELISILDDLKDDQQVIITCNINHQKTSHPVPDAHDRQGRDHAFAGIV